MVVLFPEFTQVFADPCGQTALAVLKAYPHAQAVAKAGEAAVYQVLRTVPAPHARAFYGTEISAPGERVGEQWPRLVWPCE